MINVDQVKTDKFCFYIFRNIFNNDELESIWKEALFLCDENKLEKPNVTGSATDDNGSLKKNNKGIWLENIRNVSNYLQLYKKTINNLSSYKNNDYTLNLFYYTDKDETLMSYYEDGDYYDSHHDVSCYTYIFWLFKEPKCFIGGDLYFSDINYKLQVNSNMGVLFPSWAIHSVDKITMFPGIQKYKGFGRFAFSTFYKIK
jgi:Rps23 Pro-64 3,4-dihydroxylase Tpa1-like proline 4-hydroxylase